MQIRNCSIRFVTLFVGVFYSTVSYSDNVVINLSSEIELSKLYADSISSLYFSPSNLMLSLNSAQTGFADTDTDLHIETTIPRTQSAIAYDISVSENKASCFDLWGTETEQTAFTTIMLDGTELVTPREILDFNSNDGTNKTSVHDIALSFKSFDEIQSVHPARRCDGSVKLMVGISV